jgi:hypothetical protein
MIKTTLRYIGVVVSLILGVEICILFFFSSQEKYAPEYSLNSPSHYTNLFNDSAKRNMVLYVTNQIKGRLPISRYVYDERLSVIVYELNVRSNSTIDSLINSHGGSAGIIFGKRFYKLDIGQLNLSYACDSVGFVDRVFLYTNDDSAKVTYKSQDVLCIKALIDNLAIRYEKAGSPDILIEKRPQDSQKIPIELTFAKQNGSLYVILISPMINNQNDFGQYAQFFLNPHIFS